MYKIYKKNKKPSFLFIDTHIFKLYNYTKGNIFSLIIQSAPANKTKVVNLMGKKLNRLLLSSAILSAATIAGLTVLTQSKKTLARENQTSETRTHNPAEEKIAQVENRTVKAFLEYYSRNHLTSASSLPMLDDLEADTRIVVIDPDDADKSLPPAIGTSVDGSEGPVGGTVDSDGQYVEFDTSDHSQSATVQEIRDAIAQILG